MDQLATMFAELKAFVADADEKLDSLTDSESAGKRKITNDLVSKYENDWTPVASGLSSQFESMSVEALTGCLTGIVRSLHKTFDEKINAFVTEQAESAPKAEPLITEDEAATLSEKRTTAMGQLRNIRELALSMDTDADENEWVLPPVRRGGRGKRGKRALSYYNWSIDGEAVAEDSNTPAGVAKLLGYDKAKEFTDVLRAAKVDTRKPPVEFSVEANGKKVTAVRGEDYPADEEIEDETSEEEVEEEVSEETE